MPNIITYENLIPLTNFRLRACEELRLLNSFNFLSFQDALHYLILAYNLQNKKILIPAFYCNTTIEDMEKHGLQIILCKIDYKKFDVNISDFKIKLQTEQPDIILIYNFFGKNSLLYDNLDWKKYLKKDAILISDFAHSLLPNHNIEFLSNMHFYIDSTRKTTCRMTSHLIMPEEIHVNTKLVVRHSAFKIALRIIFSLKNSCLRLSALFKIKSLSNLGAWFYLLHDKYIGSSRYAFRSFWWDSFLYKRINFAKIRKHRQLLYREYREQLKNVSDQGYIEIFDLPPKEAENICFFFIRIIQYEHITPLLNLLWEKGFWAEVLWNFDAIKNISPDDRDWAKSIAILPYTMATTPHHIQCIASLMEEFFNNFS